MILTDVNSEAPNFLRIKDVGSCATRKSGFQLTLPSCRFDSGQNFRAVSGALGGDSFQPAFFFLNPSKFPNPEVSLCCLLVYVVSFQVLPLTSVGVLGFQSL